MEYVYASLLLHESKQEINEKNVTKVLEASGAHVDSSRVKALVASLKEVNIDEAIKKASVMQAVSAPVQAASGAEQKGKKEEKKEEDEAKSEEAAAEGLGSLFG